MSHADAWAHARMVEEVIRAVSFEAFGQERALIAAETDGRA